MKWDEYQKKKQGTFNVFNDGQTWLKTEIECPVCGEPVYKNITMALATYPPMYKYRCPKCNWMETGY